MVMIVMSAVYSLSSYPAGILAIRTNRQVVLGASLIALASAQVALSLYPGTLGFWLGVALWGLHMGLSQGGLSAAVAQSSPADMYATSFGLFHLVTGVFQLASGVLAGWLWVTWGSAAAFAGGALWAVLALAALVASNAVFLAAKK